MEDSKLLKRIMDRIERIGQEYADAINAYLVKMFNKWPCLDTKFLLVGSESSGTTAIANLLFLEIPSIRFLDEGDHQWVWEAYQSIFQKKRRIRDYPRLQLFDAIKVPGFASIIDEFRKGFPNSEVIYVVRDPRDFINSAIKTWKVKNVGELSTISWSKENWLNIPNKDPIERLSIRWKKYINLAMDQDDIIFVRYEDFCEDKVETIKNLSSQIGLPFNEDRTKRICDKQLCHTSVRNYNPQGPGGWKRGILVNEHIKKIEKICEKEMIRWKYNIETM
jgi:hypothetical protein